jgi:hypothetical protein
MRPHLDRAPAGNKDIDKFFLVWGLQIADQLGYWTGGSSAFSPTVSQAGERRQSYPGTNQVHLTRAAKSVNCIFCMATLPNPLEDTLQDFQFPQREAAFFYGLFLRGHSADELRRDIAVPATVLAKWDRETGRDPQLRSLLERIVSYRRHVLAIFENLICHDASKQKLQ